MKGISRFRQYNTAYPIDYGYIIIPVNLDRDQYVKNCFSRERVSVMYDSGSGMIRDCYISKEVLREITFPEDSDSLGTMVILASNPYNNKPVIIAAVSKESETQLLEEGEFRQEKSFNDNKVSISGLAKEGTLLVDVERGDGVADFIINIRGTEGANFKINCKGDATIYSDDTVNLETTGTVNIKSIKEDDEETFTSITVDNETVKVNEGSEAVLLGDKTVTELSKEVKALTDLLDSIANIIPANVPAGAPDPTWVAWQLAVETITQRGDLSEVKSKITFTD